MAVTYLYLDDEDPERVRPFTRAVKRGVGGLDIVLDHPSPYRDQIDELERKDFDGLILDLRLDQFTGWAAEGEDAEKADYRAATLAQEIRTRAAEHSAKKGERGRGEYPIVLWSTDERLDESYERDHTSHNLFDLLCVKGHITSDEEGVADEKKAPWVARRLLALAEGYDAVAATRDEVGRKKGQFYRFLGFDERPEFLDERVANLEPFDQRLLFRPAHEYARFIRRELLETTGPLIDRATLAARFGIDVATSKDTDRLFDEHLSGAAYKGPFALGWPRWWARLVEDVWRDLIGADNALRPLPASERVELLREHTGLRRLHAAIPQLPDQSSRFWVSCRATGAPIDPRDGFVLDSQNRFPWQGDEYVSLQAVLRGLRETGLRLSPSERKRAELAKKRLG